MRNGSVDLHSLTLITERSMLIEIGSLDADSQHQVTR